MGPIPFRSTPRSGVTVLIIASGVEAVWYFLLPRRWFARYVLRRLKKSNRYVDWIELEDKSVWDRDGNRAET